MDEIILKINEISKDMGEVRIMEVCGGHTNTIMKYGIRDILPKNIKLISGPGCPVCVTSQYDIDCMIELAIKGIKVATYGDMTNVPGSKMSLKDAQELGADVKTIYSVDQIINDKERVFFAVGFETTTPMTAVLLSKGIKVFCAHKVIPPAMRVLTKEMKIDGFIDPGHVSTIIGSEIWKNLDIPVPQVISSFKPEGLLKATYELLKLIKENRIEVLNEYPEVVFPQGNLVAKKLIENNLKFVDAEWRGIGIIPNSGLAPINPELDARIIYKDLFNDVKSSENNGCRCGEIVRGLIEPVQCKFFGKECTPSSPMGACMVSESEGACAIAYKYGKSLSA
ncbi:hydrogenase formation protein HypD [Candidatus Pacearchaeota archaeon CG10_big_fil_rev_8_21_14_0_10_32_14]|nr:MAG: hydrogenase formation protein HypD [Candidatus Pacearchaeota archaeon CG10_big_fil_rev_8_21_14_0_10_32_14]